MVNSSMHDLFVHVSYNFTSSQMLHVLSARHMVLLLYMHHLALRTELKMTKNDVFEHDWNAYTRVLL